LPASRSVNRTWRIIYIVAGALALAYAIYAHELISGLALLLLIIGGALLIMKGLAAR
jgi:hypothetical protein